MILHRSLDPAEIRGDARDGILPERGHVPLSREIEVLSGNRLQFGARRGIHVVGRKAGLPVGANGHGEKDYRVPLTQGLEYYSTLRIKGVPSRLVYFPEIGRAHV